MAKQIEEMGASSGGDDIAALKAKLAALEGKGSVAEDPGTHPDDPGPGDAQALEGGEPYDPETGEVRGITSSPEDRRPPEDAPPTQAAPPATTPPGTQQAAPPATTTPAGAVAVVSDDIMARYERDAGKGLSFNPDDMIIPRLVLLQDNSPQVKEGTSSYVPGARPGLIMNSVTKALAATVLVVPVQFSRRYVMWKPRDERGDNGALLDMDIGIDAWEAAEKVPGVIGKRFVRHEKGRDGIAEINDTPEYSALTSWDGGVSWQPAVIDCSGTKASAAGRANALLAMQEVQLPDGRTIQPPIFATILQLRTARQGEGSNSYFVYDFTLHGRVTELKLYDRAAKLARDFEQGQATVAADVQV